MLARQAAAIDDLSGGRLVLGLGTGWMEREHTMFGYALGDVPTRFTRVEEGLEIITRLLRSSEPVDFEGQFFQVRGAALPGPARPGGPEIQIGGTGPKRTLPLVARYANAWNAHVIGPAELRERISTCLTPCSRPRAGSPGRSGGRSTSPSYAGRPLKNCMRG
jgi:alkanesulfonate monooxygenase SsuD/methylene tetrahydromethanopterin reductase-like flavin-dependent oxidoreductase (luciferase family)